MWASVEEFRNDSILAELWARLLDHEPGEVGSKWLRAGGRRLLLHIVVAVRRSLPWDVYDLVVGIKEHDLFATFFNK